MLPQTWPPTVAIPRGADGSPPSLRTYPTSRLATGSQPAHAGYQKQEEQEYQARSMLFGCMRGNLPRAGGLGDPDVVGELQWWLCGGVPNYRPRKKQLNHAPKT